MNERAHIKSISHRGKGGGFPDNTLEALESAIERGFQWVEFDVRSTGDNVLVLFHDEMIDDCRVRDLSYSELKSKAGHHVATLEEALALVKGRIKSDIEFKEYHFVREGMSLVLEHLRRDEFIVSSFDYTCLELLSSLDLNISFGLIMGALENPDAFVNREVDSALIGRLESMGAGFIVMSELLYLRGAGDRVKNSKLDLLLWGLSHSPRIQGYLADDRIKGLCVDEAYWSKS